MSLPPQILRIKRKRVDEPVDSLYIEEDGHKSKTKRRVTEQDFIFRRLVANENVSDRLHNSQALRPPIPVKSNGIPIVMRTLPSQGSSFSPPKDPDAQKGALEDQAAGDAGVLGPRRFHLSKLSAAVAANQSSSTGSKRRRRDQGANIAVFEERQPLKGESKDAGGDQAVSASFERDAKKMSQTMNRSPRKRPGATAAISKSASSASLRRMQQDDVKAAETRVALQKYAMEELGTSAEPEKLNQGERLNHDPDAMETDGSDNEYIYDTYVRQAYAAPGETESSIRDKPRHALNANAAAADSARLVAANGVETFGYIVLPPRPSSAPGSREAPNGSSSAEFWGTFGDALDDGGGDSEEEADWDTEQDDENAENFYGADYPEDELDSADERGDQAAGYARFRGAGRGVSDDEDEYRDFGAEGGDDYDAFDVHNSWNMKPRGRVWRLGGNSSYQHHHHHHDDDEHDFDNDGGEADDEGDV